MQGYAAGLHVEHLSLLVGLLWDADERRMTSDHATKKGGIRYRYYVSCQDKERLKLRRLRVPAGDLERLVIAQLHAWRCTAPEQLVTRDEVRSAVERIMVTAEAVHIDFVDSNGSVIIPVQFFATNGERRIDVPGGGGTGRLDPALVKLLVRAHQARRMFDAASSIESAATKLRLTKTYYAMLLRLSFLAPDITAAILDGRQPVSPNRQKLARIGNLPIDWNEQRSLLGFA
jgi:hypothetical protein